MTKLGQGVEVRAHYPIEYAINIQTVKVIKQLKSFRATLDNNLKTDIHFAFIYVDY